MKKRLNIMQAKEIEGRDKPYWARIGTLFMDEGGKISIKLDVSPYPNKEGDVWLRCFEDDRKQDGVPAQQGNPWG